MEFKDLLLIFQLVRGLESTFLDFEKAFNDSDKEKFESSKRALLDFQKKIESVLR